MEKTYQDVYKHVMNTSQAKTMNELVNDFLRYAIDTNDIMLKSEILENQAYALRQEAKYKTLGGKTILLNKEY